MADNIPITPGSGATVATDDVAGVQFQRVKITLGGDGVDAGDLASGNPLPVAGPLTDAQLRAADVETLVKATPTGYFPLYSGQETSAPAALHIDPDGSLITRGATLTDEGTFRANFANTSLAVGIGAVTVSGTAVTGAGFLTTDVHIRDYFKLAADAESAWVQIESVDSDTQLTLASAYTGGTSGTGNRALMRPYTGAGGSISVGSGQLTLGGGTTASAITGVGRYTDFAPLIFRTRASISQRIANQDIHIGLEEDAATTRWFARFLANGTTNTTLICETGRNPTGAPSAAETEQTTITLPNGATTAALNEYRVELLTEFVRFFVNDVLVAQHARVIPHQHDEMTSHIEIRNGTTPASNTNVVVDYITGKNHNKVEVGIMSAAEQIVANPAPLNAYTYNVAGVIPINTDLLIIDCSQVRGVYIQCTAMGTTGVVTPAFSNDGVTYVNTTLITPAFASATTFNAAGMWYVPVLGRYLRLRLTTATTAGTTTLNVQGTQQPPQLYQATQPVSGTVTANIGTGSLAAGTNAIGDVGIQARANATGAASIHHFVAAASTNALNIKASAGRVLGWSLANTTASWRYVKLHNTAGAPTAGAGVVATIGIPPNGIAQVALPAGLGFATGIARTCVTGAADADATATAANDVVGDIYFA